MVKKLCSTSWERRVTTCVKQSCRHQGQCIRRAGGASGTRAEIPLRPGVQTMVTQAIPLQHMEVDSGADIKDWRYHIGELNFFFAFLTQ